jgi:fumarate reductase subunit C
MKKLIVALVFFVLCMPLVSLAHPGHGETGGFTITHYFTEPVHVIVSLVALVGVILYARYLKKSEQRK